MKKILIVVDMQTDFIDGSLGTKEAVTILPMVEKKTFWSAGFNFFTMFRGSKEKKFRIATRLTKAETTPKAAKTTFPGRPWRLTTK